MTSSIYHTQTIRSEYNNQFSFVLTWDGVLNCISYRCKTYVHGIKVQLMYDNIVRKSNRENFYIKFQFVLTQDGISNCISITQGPYGQHKDTKYIYHHPVW